MSTPIHDVKHGLTFKNIKSYNLKHKWKYIIIIILIILVIGIILVLIGMGYSAGIANRGWGGSTSADQQN